MNLRRGVIGRAFDFIYPPVCIACGEAGPQANHLLLCRKCLEKINLRPGYMCGRCGAAMHREPDEGRPCPRCFTNRMNFAQAVSAGDYEGPLGAVARGLKFSGLRFLAAPLAKELAHVVAARIPMSDIHLVTPVPLHWTRRLKRGFNQSALIARALAKGLDLKYAPALRRAARTRPQTGLPAAARLKNPLNAFVARDKFLRDGRNVLLVDDIMTTGATLMECARVLRKAGAKRIYVAVVAR
jgi:ComF family protein